MTFQPGDTLLHYRIVEKLGEGGMGEVWKAVDTTLDRNVAIKVLPETFAVDPERLTRFEREAKTLAALSHPNIAGIFGLHEVPSSPGNRHSLRFLAMEFLEGEDLSQRLRRGPLPVDEAVAVATAVAEALSAAHAIGVVHRDLKPANVMLAGGGTRSGAGPTVKVLDFGLAKAAAPDASTSDPQGALSPTVTSFGTAAHVILGTAAYMAPEQARGRPVDKRADLWGLGVFLLEMLTGKAPFAGETVSDTLASVLKTDPDWAALPPRTPPAVRRLLRRLLEKDPRNRLHDANDARIELEHAFDEPASGSAPTDAAGAAPSRPWGLLAAVAAAALVAGVAVGMLLRGGGGEAVPRTSPGRVISNLELPEGVTLDLGAVPLALSPGGERIVFVGLDDKGERRLFVRRLDSTEARPIPGTEGGWWPFWSPDGREVAFFSGATQLMRIAVDGGTPQPVATAEASGGAWGADGSILVSRDRMLWRVDAAGGEMRPVECSRAQGNAFAAMPQWLPGGRHFLFQITDLEGGGQSGVYLGDLESAEARLLLEGYTQGLHADGRLLYLKGDILMGWRFDLERHDTVGEPARVASPVLRSNYPFQGYFSAAGGRLVYLDGSRPLGLVEAVWIDRTGTDIESTGIEGDLYNPRLSRDGRRLAIDHSSLETHGDVWVHDLVRGSSLRLTSDPTDESLPVWLPGDTRLAFFRVPDLYTIDVAGGAEARSLYTNERRKVTRDVSPDGRWLIFQERRDSADLRVLDLQSGEARDWLATEWEEEEGRFSPDGRWVAYRSNESGRKEIWIDGFPVRGERFRVSTGGGKWPVWRHDGKELFYHSDAQQVMAVPVDMGSERHPIGEPRPLFGAKLRDGSFDVSPDGRRFLVLRQLDVSASSIVLEQNG